MITLSPAWAGFIKGLLNVVVPVIVAYLANPSHLTMLSGGLALVVAGIFSAVESSMKASTNGNTALFGAVRLKY